MALGCSQSLGRSTHTRGTRAQQRTQWDLMPQPFNTSEYQDAASTTKLSPTISNLILLSLSTLVYKTSPRLKSVYCSESFGGNRNCVISVTCRLLKALTTFLFAELTDSTDFHETTAQAGVRLLPTEVIGYC